jgi:hypothetical protein
MTRLMDSIFNNEERSKTILATVAAVGGLAAIVVSLAGSLLK